jgi:heptosyltransferase-2
MTVDGTNTHAAVPQRLLLVKLGAIGDVVMAIPGAYAMHLQGHSVDWLCGETVAPVLELYPWIRPVMVNEQELLRGRAWQRIGALLRLWGRLAGRRYDLCATLYYDSRYRALTLPVRARRRWMLSKLDRATRLLPGRHHTDEYARILLGRGDGEAPMQLAPVPAQGLPETPLPRAAAEQRIVIVPAGARNLLRDDGLRRWPVESYVELAVALLQRGYRVVLCGGPEDVWASPLFAALAVTDLIGKLSLLQTLALLDSADVAVTHDTGPLHLAGLTSTAIVTVFGPTDPRGRLPQRANCVALWGGEGFACRPCYDGRDYAPCTYNGCVRQISPAMVLEQVEQLVRARAEGRMYPPRVIVPEHTPVASWAQLPGVLS